MGFIPWMQSAYAMRNGTYLWPYIEQRCFASYFLDSECASLHRKLGAVPRPDYSARLESTSPSLRSRLTRLSVTFLLPAKKDQHYLNYKYSALMVVFERDTRSHALRPVACALYSNMPRDVLWHRAEPQSCGKGWGGRCGVCLSGNTLWFVHWLTPPKD